jgi:hypothetical protein
MLGWDSKIDIDNISCSFCELPVERWVTSSLFVIEEEIKIIGGKCGKRKYICPPCMQAFVGVYYIGILQKDQDNDGTCHECKIAIDSHKCHFMFCAKMSTLTARGQIIGFANFCRECFCNIAGNDFFE